MIKSLFAAAAGLLMTSASAQETFRSPEVTAQIQQANKSFAERGYTATAWSNQDDLKTGGESKFAIRLDAGDTYSFLAVCGKGCTDLDLRVSDAAGNELGADTKDDAIPIVQIKAPKEGIYTVQVIMTACAATACPIGLKAYKKN